MKLLYTGDYALLIDEEAEIYYDDYWIYLNGNEKFDGVVTKSNLTEETWYSKLHDRFAYKKIIAYYPLSKEATELDLPLLPNIFEEAELNNAYVNFCRDNPTEKVIFSHFAAGYKAAQSDKQFSLEDMKKAMFEVYKNGIKTPRDGKESFSEISNRVIQSLSTQQLPKDFVPDTNDIGFMKHANIMVGKKLYDIIICPFKSITNSEGKEELVGTYKY